MRQIDELERAAARHWQAPETQRLGEWLLRAAQGFTGRANSALPLGDPGVPLPEAVAAVTDWYLRRALPPMIAVPLPLADARGHRLDDFLAERSWVLRSGPALVMTAAIADIPAPDPHIDVQLDPEPGPDWLALYRYRGQELPPIAPRLLMSAPWQAFGSIRRDGQAVAVGRVSVAGSWGAITAVEVDAELPAAGAGRRDHLRAGRGGRAPRCARVLLQVETGNDPARALYLRCGFRDAHRYHYRVAPVRHAG